MSLTHMKLIRPRDEMATTAVIRAQTVHVKQRSGSEQFHQKRPAFFLTSPLPPVLASRSYISMPTEESMGSETLVGYISRTRPQPKLYLVKRQQ